MAGPIWSAPLHDPTAVSQLLKLVQADKAAFPGYDKVHALLTAVSEELPDVPLYDSLHSLCSLLKCTPPPSVLVRSALINAGYRVSGTHASPLGLKTDAPAGVLWDILRCWVREHPVKAVAAKEGAERSVGQRILAVPPASEANFARARGAFSRAQEEKTPRFPANPESHWGPKMRAGRHAAGEGEGDAAPAAKKARQA